MTTRITLLWILGLITIVPYGIYYLLFHARRDEYALVITPVPFRIFGFRDVAGPIVSAIKIRRVFKLEMAQSREKLIEILSGQDSQDAAIDLIASGKPHPAFSGQENLPSVHPEFPSRKRGIFRRGKEIKGLRGGVHRYAAPFRGTGEWTSYGCLKGRGPRTAGVTRKPAD